MLTPRQKLEQKKLDEELKEIRDSNRKGSVIRGFGKGFVQGATLPALYSASQVSLLGQKAGQHYVSKREREGWLQAALESRGVDKGEAKSMANKLDTVFQKNVFETKSSKGNVVPTTLQRALNKVIPNSMSGEPALNTYNTLMGEGFKLKGKMTPKQEYSTWAKGIGKQVKKALPAPLLIGLMGGLYGINSVKKNRETYKELFKGAGVGDIYKYFAQELHKIAEEATPEQETKALVTEEDEEKPKEIIRKVDQKIKTPGSIFGTEVQRMESGRVKSFPLFDVPEGYVFNKDLQAFLPDPAQGWMRDGDVGLASAKREGYIQAKKESILQKMKEPSPMPTAPAPMSSAPTQMPQQQMPKQQISQQPAPRPSGMGMRPPTAPTQFK